MAVGDIFLCWACNNDAKKDVAEEYVLFEMNWPQKKAQRLVLLQRFFEIPQR